ncbi:hypothetical protein AJ79_02033 [Helicocarpus griseus UAMH5409]|uniref:Uncharacterized protein n=1 Tax=Helicocarpus griseus UAMH5409 TaxID=1447875 RepID=A0A2B7Y4W5_9EURO|nr:hypothetical protein AJ79_02033 [Helicocarpus griseus UAMH5409]
MPPPAPPPHSSTPLSASILVARFLRSNNYTQTLAAFIEEAGLPEQAGSFEPGLSDENWTIEKIMDEKKTFDKSLGFERVGGKRGDGLPKWKVPAPSTPTIIETPSTSNMLFVSAQPYTKTMPDGHPQESSIIIATQADKRLSAVDICTGHSITATYTNISDSPILCCASLYDGAFRAITDMSGKLYLWQGQGPKLLDVRSDHTKYAVSVVTWQEEPPEVQKTWLATAGWDSKILIYYITPPDVGGQLAIGEPVAYIKTETVPECIQFIRNRETGDLDLIVSRRDSTNLYYYLVESPINRIEKENNKHIRLVKMQECPLLGKQNLAPHSNAWVAFSPAWFAQSPRDPNLLAVATSSQPHMRLIIVKMLIPTQPSQSQTQQQAQPSAAPMSSSQSRVPVGRPAARGEVPRALQHGFAELALQNREDAAILVQVNTMAPQTPYSIPQVAWRPDGSGVWVNGDDGLIRGFETRTGKLITTLRNGHEAGSKVRSIWAGAVPVLEGRGEDGVEEWVLSGGFDKKLIVWK